MLSENFWGWILHPQSFDISIQSYSIILLIDINSLYQHSISFNSLVVGRTHMPRIGPAQLLALVADPIFVSPRHRSRSWEVCLKMVVSTKLASLCFTMKCFFVHLFCLFIFHLCISFSSFSFHNRAVPHHTRPRQEHLDGVASGPNCGCAPEWSDGDPDAPTPENSENSKAASVVADQKSTLNSKSLHLMLEFLQLSGPASKLSPLNPISAPAA